MEQGICRERKGVAVRDVEWWVCRVVAGVGAVLDESVWRAVLHYEICRN